MTTETEIPDTQYDEWDPALGEDELYQPYRSVSKAAVFALVTAVLALLGLLLPALLLFAVLAAVLGLVALRNLRRYPDELTGRTAAVLGLIGGVVLFVSGTAMHTYIYMTEVPEGYQRISFSELQTDEDPMIMGAAALPSELDGKRIFIKGYVHPGVSDLGEIRRFILVPDMGTCCFGGQPALTDMVEVRIVGERGVRYSQRKRKFAGTFRVSPRLKQVAGGLTGGYYELDADYVK
jgi:hypothetical protein